MPEIRIIHAPEKDGPFAVVVKPAGLPSAPLTPGGDSALTRAAAEFPELTQVRGRKEIEFGLLHRLDTAARGLLVIAATQAAYETLLASQRDGRFLKSYRAECRRVPDNSARLGGFPPADGVALRGLAAGAAVSVRSYFRNYGRGAEEVRPVTERSGRAALRKCGRGRLYTTEMILKDRAGDFAAAECRISSGYRHQVRCHLAWAGFPVIGDLIYNSTERDCGHSGGRELRFQAFALEFPCPVSGRMLTFEI